MMNERKPESMVKTRSVASDFGTPEHMISAVRITNYMRSAIAVEVKE